MPNWNRENWRLQLRRLSEMWNVLLLGVNNALHKSQLQILQQEVCRSNCEDCSPICTADSKGRVNVPIGGYNPLASVVRHVTCCVWWIVPSSDGACDFLVFLLFPYVP
jgi:hypothetical protein